MSAFKTLVGLEHSNKKNKERNKIKKGKPKKREAQLKERNTEKGLKRVDNLTAFNDQTLV